MRTSERGKAALKQHEACALLAYRDIAGVLTIGWGLTSASGVITVTPGMRITQDEADRLFELSLERNYEPAVHKAMPDAKQHEFDAGVLFHYNTGAIERASWVQFWRNDAPRWKVEEWLYKWNKAGGKVSRGLLKRRQDEAKILFDKIYPSSFRHPESGAHWTVELPLKEREELRRIVEAFGYDPGDTASAIGFETVKTFQRDHGLTVDGIIGPATIATIRRRRAAAPSLASAAVAAAAAPAAAVSGVSGGMSPISWALVAVAMIGAGFITWRYRDAIAAKINSIAPRLAGWIRTL